MSYSENTPKPHPPIKKAVVPVSKKPVATKEEKKPHQPKPHLTQRPFGESAVLQRLREQTQQDAPKNPRRVSKKGSSK